MQPILQEALTRNNLTVTPAQFAQLILFTELMQRWNKTFNLTSITEPREIAYLHIVDSLVVQPFLHGTHLCDVGSGGGLPGIPLAIINPERNWTLLDKNNKKTRFITQVIAELGLKNVQAVHQRCEDFQPAICFDSILSRAFGTLTMFTAVTQHLLCQDGVFVAMKGKYPKEELDELPSAFKVTGVTQLDIKGTDIDRHIVCLRLNK